MRPKDENSGRPFPKKRFGQHFLTDKNIIGKILKAADLKKGEHIIEIGPGTGALTEGLLGAGVELLAVEVDRDLVSLLKERFADYPNFSIVNANALKVSFLELSKERGARFKAVSNLPYNISGPILSKFINERDAFSLLVLMFQKEVAERIVAGPGTKEYGVLSVLSQAYAEVKIEFHVSRNLFTPRPKVDSSVVSLRILESPRVNIPDEGFFRTVVRAAFGTRRKTLANSLKALGLGKERILSALNECSIDPGRRGETLSLAEFGRLAEVLRTSA